MVRDVYAGAVKTLPRRTYQGAIKRVLTQHPLTTETLWRCDHRHRLVRTARDCAARNWPRPTPG